MKEKNTTLNILAHAFGNTESILELSGTEFLARLRNRGFSEESISVATAWIMQLMQQQFAATVTPATANSLRIFAAEEMAKLDVDCRNFILSLENSQILEPKTREIVINQVLLLNQNTISISDIKLVTLIVLLLQPANDDKRQKLERLALKTAPQKY